jgi:hypothetical protein
VALDANRRQPAVPDVDHPGVLAGTHNHPRGLGGEPSKVHSGGLVGAVLRPHDGEHPQFGRTGGSAEDFDDPVVLVVGESEDAVGGNSGGHGTGRGSRCWTK